MTPFYTYVGIHSNKVVHRYVDANGRRHTDVLDHDFSLYLPHQDGEYQNIYKQPLKKKVFNKPNDMGEFVREYKDVMKINGMTKPEYQFITDNYPDRPVRFDFEKIKIINIDIETEVGHGFPDPDVAEQAITAITASRIGTKETFTWTTLDYDSAKDSEWSLDNKVYLCGSEKELTTRFLSWWNNECPDAVTGWNCVPLTNSIWSDTKIDVMSNVQYKQKLYDSYIHHVFPISQKPVWTTVLDNGKIVDSSKDHIFPVWYLPKGKYIADKTSLVYNELALEKIKELTVDNNVYMEQVLRDNTNPDLTWRTLILDNLEWLHDNNIVIRVYPDTALVKKVSAIVGYASKETHKSIDFWNSKNIESLVGKGELLQYISKTDTLTLVPEDKISITRWYKTVRLDDVLDSELLWMLGMWFTDGTQTYKTECTIYNTSRDIISRLCRVVGKPNNNKLGKDGCYNIRFGLSDYWLEKLFVYKSVESRVPKMLNMGWLSMLSKSQFLAFVAGLIDGDGSKSGNAVLLSNYDNQLQNFSELLQWNGIFSAITDNAVRFYCIDDDFVNNVVLKYKVVDQYVEGYNHDSKSNNRRWIYNDNLVRVKDIIETDNVVDMIDIETSTHLFVTNGVRTHNCVGFDLPYMVNRFTQIVGSETNLLSPIHDIAYRPISKKPHPATGKDMVKIEGLAILDFLQVFKKFDFGSPPDYKLETIAQQVLGKGKVDYGEYDNIKDFYLGNPTKFIRYNIIDVLLVNEMEDVLKFLLLAYTLQYWSKCNTQDIFGQVTFWDIYIYNFLHKKGIVVPPSKNVTPFPLEGAFVAEPKLGKHRWVVSFDLTSLYPMCIRQYNMGPETLIRGTQRRPGLMDDFIGLKDNDEVEEARRLKAAIAGNGAMFSKEEQSILSAVVDELFDNRVKFKTEMKQLERRLEEIKHEIHVNGHNPQLGEEYNKVHNNIMVLEAQQMAMKIAINSLYGSLGNEGFRYYDPSIAEAVTQSGQLAVQFIAREIATFLDNRLGILRGLDRWIYTDTDSVAGDSIIPTSVGNIPISELFDKYAGKVISQRDSDDFVCDMKEHILSPSVNSNGVIEHKRIKHIMKHKVKKRLFKIKCAGDEVVVTEDHSIIVSRNNQLISCKPMDILKSDKIIKITYGNMMNGPMMKLKGRWMNIEYYDEFIIEDLGVCDEWVYDIEIEDNHNFFANNILVHNSIYITLDDFVDKLTNGNESAYPKQKIVDAIDMFCKKQIEPCIRDGYDRLAQHMNAYENAMSMKREVIADRALFRAKKNYVMQVYDNEGVRYETPKIKMMGVETARSTTPQFVKDALVESYKIMMNGQNQELLDMISAFKLEYMKQEVDMISTPRGVNDMDKWVDGGGHYKNRIPFHVRASHEYNRLLKEHNLKDLTPIQNGDKVRIVAILPTAPVSGNYIAYKDTLPKELDLHQFVDKETLFEKTFLSPVESFTKHLGWKHIDQFDVNDFFS